MTSSYPNKRIRFLLLLLALAALAVLAHLLSGKAIPTDQNLSVVFQGSFLLVVLGSLYLEDKYTKPADAVNNSIAALVTISPALARNSDLGWISLTALSISIFLVGLVNQLLVSEESTNRFQLLAGKVSYEYATSLGKATVLFSAVFIYSLVDTFGVDSIETWGLIAIWAVYITLYSRAFPSILDEVVRFVMGKRDASEKLGSVIRVDSPGLVRVKLKAGVAWKEASLAVLGDGTRRIAHPLFVQQLDDGVVGTALLSGIDNSFKGRLSKGYVYRGQADEHKSDIETVGFVVEQSHIPVIRFETWRPDVLRQGMLVYCDIRRDRVYYQISDAFTNEEAIEKHRHGFQIVEAHQLGTRTKNGRFRNYTWLPQMNHAVNLCDSTIDEDEPQLRESEMVLGIVPGSNLNVICDVEDMISHHLAILGITGSGKTELAFRIVKHALSCNFKVFCVDITGQYNDRLHKLHPRELSISREATDILEQRMYEVDARGWKPELDELNNYREKFVQHIDKTIEAFLDGNDTLGMFSMPSISNTRSTIYASEVYLSRIFEYAKTKKVKILIVLEEAHTIVPEASTMGLQDFDSKAIIARISQIALQGRKYGVGLMVVAQRTATVSKSVLTQCNTTITFTSRDKTGLEFLSNVYGPDHVPRIPNLAFLEALVDGKGIKSERPIVVQMPYDESVAALRKTGPEPIVESDMVMVSSSDVSSNGRSSE